MDPWVESDPWMVQDAKGRAKPAPRTLEAFLPPELLPPGISQIEPATISPKVESAPFGGPYDEEFAKIQKVLEDSLGENEKRELALQRAISANVPWRKGRGLSKMASQNSIFKFGQAYHQCPCNSKECEQHKEGSF